MENDIQNSQDEVLDKSENFLSNSTSLFSTSDSSKFRLPLVVNYLLANDHIDCLSNDNNQHALADNHNSDSFAIHRYAIEAYFQLIGNRSFPVLWLFNYYPTNSNNINDCYMPKLDVYWLLAYTPTYINYEDENGIQSMIDPKYMKLLKQAIIDFHSLNKNRNDSMEVSLLSMAVAKRNPCVNVIEMIISMDDNACSQCNADGSLPIMHACACNITTAVVSLLYKYYPDSFRVRDNFGCYCIHYAAFLGWSCVLKFLLVSLPGSAEMIEGNGSLPLHDAIQNVQNCQSFGIYSDNYYNESMRMIEILLESYPSAITVADDDGALPLHKAARYGSAKVVQRILKAFPKAAFIIDQENLLPIDYAAERTNKASEELEVMQLLLEANPTVLRQTMDQIQNENVTQNRIQSLKNTMFSMWSSKQQPIIPIAPPNPQDNNKLELQMNSSVYSKSEFRKGRKSVLS
eukprot:gene13178-17656_t